MATESRDRQLTLSQTYGSDLTIVIPDLQRDYCWGLSPSGDTGIQPVPKAVDQSLVPNKAAVFVSGIIQMVLRHETTPLGVIYGYSSTLSPTHIMIVDGQQRLTTLYLLIGMLYRRTPTRELRRLLVDEDNTSVDGRAGDGPPPSRLTPLTTEGDGRSGDSAMTNGEPRLVYQARTEAMYFLTDLVYNFFLDRNGRLSQIEQSAWYYHTYASDQTIRSFIGALRQIDAVLERAKESPGWDWGKFADTVTNQLYFTYHDLGERTEAESMFITINTTGEPLTLPQIVKTMIVGADGVNDEQSRRMTAQWEEIERWGWQTRDRSNPSHPTTSDARVEQMLRLWPLINYESRITNYEKSNHESRITNYEKSNHESRITNYEKSNHGQERPRSVAPDRRTPVQLFGDLYSHFKSYATLVDLVPNALARTADSPDDLMVVQAALAYIRRWNIRRGAPAALVQGVRDIWMWLDNLTRYIKATASGSDTETVIALVNRMPKPDITYLLGLERQSNAKILNPEELCKLRLIASCPESRRTVMHLIDKAQQHPLLNGRISALIGWCKAGGGTDLRRMQQYIDTIYDVWGTDINRQERLDHLRRALLTQRHAKYPISRRGDTCLSLCWSVYEWQRLMQTAPGLIRQILDHVIGAQRPPIDTLRRMAQRFKDTKNPYFFIITNDSVLHECHNRTLLKPSAPFIGYYTIDPTDAQRPGYKRWYVEQLPLAIDRAGWQSGRAYGARCLFTDHRTYNLAIDLYHTDNERAPYRIEVFARRESSKADRIDVKAWLESQGLAPAFDKRTKRHYLLCRNAAEAVQAIGRLTTPNQDITMFVIK